MKKGGYQIIDLSAYKFTNGESQIIKNVYNIIKNTKKVVLISGLTVDDTEYHDMFAVFIPYETYFCGLAQYEGNNICFVVNNDGSVTVNVSENAKEPIAYLYNGVRLPPLPELDREVYQYLCMGKTLFGGNTYVILYASPVLPTTWDGNVLYIPPYYHGVQGDVQVQQAGAYANSENWTIEDTHEGGFTLSISDVLWANYDVLNLDGTIYLAESEPVPVYK